MVETPQLQFIDRFVAVPVVLQRRVPTPQVQYNDKVVNVPVVMQRPVPTFQTVQNNVEMPKVQFSDRVVDNASRHTTPGADDPERAEDCRGIADPER